jgi:hypothetical protein
MSVIKPAAIATMKKRDTFPNAAAGAIVSGRASFAALKRSNYRGGWSPGDATHLSMEAAMSACLAFRESTSRSGPCGSRSASSRSRSASLESRSGKVRVFLKRRRCMAALYSLMRERNRRSHHR